MQRSSVAASTGGWRGLTWGGSHDLFCGTHFCGGFSYSSVAPYLSLFWRPIPCAEGRCSTEGSCSLSIPLSEPVCQLRTQGSCWAHLIARSWPFTSLKAGKLIGFTTGWVKCKSPVGLTMTRSQFSICISPGLDLSLMPPHMESEIEPVLVLMWSLFWCKTPSGFGKTLFFEEKQVVLVPGAHVDWRINWINKESDHQSSLCWREKEAWELRQTISFFGGKWSLLQIMSLKDKRGKQRFGLCDLSAPWVWLSNNNITSHTKGCQA